MTENKNGLNITMDNKEMMRIGAIAVLILDIIFMLSSYIKIDAISQLASLIGGYSDMNLGNGKYTFFGMISLIRKIIVLNDSDYAPVSYLFMTFFWGLHIIVIGITVKGAINLFTKQIDNVHTNGKAGTIFAFGLAAATIIFCIVANVYIESETDGYISGLVGLCFAPFCVCALCIAYNMYFLPKLTMQTKVNQEAHQKEETEKKCDKCGLEFEYLPEVCPNCNAWKCEFCDTFNSQYEEYCEECGFARLGNAEINKRNDNRQSHFDTKPIVNESTEFENDNKNEIDERNHTVSDELKGNTVDGWVCTRCSAKNKNGSKFCTNCGAQKEQIQVKKSSSWFCKKCDSRNDESAKFCSNCGAARE